MVNRLVPPGAEAFPRDLPKAEVHLIDAGHFALESNLDEIAGYVMPFLRRNIGTLKKM
jgi:pimeloyl-ACP methyl ester carboxylesterase